MSIKDLFRLGKHPPPGEGSDHARPRPVLVKLTTIWDKRLLLLSKQKLKEFKLSRIFIRPDFSPQERATRISITCLFETLMLVCKSLIRRLYSWTVAAGKSVTKGGSLCLGPQPRRR